MKAEDSLFDYASIWLMPCLADMSYFVCLNNEVADLLKLKLNVRAERQISMMET